MTARPPDATVQPSGSVGRRAGSAGVIAAGVDIGSTSVHLLVAQVATVPGDADAGANAGLTVLLDASELLGLGSRIEADGMLGSGARATLAETLAGYATEARRLAAGAAIVFVGTDPLRHAADAARACREIELSSGVPVHVLDQDEEGVLTLLGVFAGRVERNVAIIDIGGGSTEIVVAGPDGIREIVGLPLGASRLNAIVDPDDPPTASNMAALRREAGRIVADAPDLDLGDVVAVGGTAYGLARVATGPGFGERIVDRAGVSLAAALAAREPSGRLAELFGLNPRRAQILPAGAAIAEALVERYRIGRIRVSEWGIREGLVRAIVRDRHAWRDRLTTLAPRRADA